MIGLVERFTARAPDEIIGPDNHPYMRRWFLLKHGRWPRVYLHQFIRSDDDRALHDHPWWFVSLILRGSYTEHTETGLIRRRAGSVAFRRATHAHRVELDTAVPSFYDFGGYHWDASYHPVWTLVVTGNKSREWGFWCPQGWRHWTQFVGTRGCE